MTQLTFHHHQEALIPSRKNYLLYLSSHSTCLYLHNNTHHCSFPFLVSVTLLYFKIQKVKSLHLLNFYILQGLAHSGPSEKYIANESLNIVKKILYAKGSIAPK